MFFNVAREKSGKLGQSGDVIRRSCVFLPTLPHMHPHGQGLAYAHVRTYHSVLVPLKLASQVTMKLWASRRRYATASD